VRPGHRKRGLTRELACAAVDFAKPTAHPPSSLRDRGGPTVIWGDGFVGVARVPHVGFAEIRSPLARRP